MAKGFGVAALVLVFFAIIAFFPINLLLSAAAIVCAVIAAFAGDRLFGTATALLVAGNIFILSPMTWTAIIGEAQQGGTVFVLLILAFISAPFLAMLLNARSKKA